LNFLVSKQTHIYVSFVLFCTEPLLFNAPVTGHRMPVYVLPHDNIAYLYKSNIFGLDFRGNYLNITTSKDTFHHCLCRNATDVVYIRTDPDEYGNYNDSIFHVDIIGKVLNVIPEKRLSLPWSYGSWIYNYLCNQCLSSLMMWVRIWIRARCTTLRHDLRPFSGFLQVLRIPPPIKLTVTI
jgi:hypothetical protein